MRDCDVSVKCVGLRIICAKPKFLHKHSIFRLDEALLMSRLKSPVTTMFPIPESTAKKIDVCILSKTAELESGGL